MRNLFCSLSSGLGWGCSVNIDFSDHRETLTHNMSFSSRLSLTLWLVSSWLGAELSRQPCWRKERESAPPCVKRSPNSPQLCRNTRTWCRWDISMRRGFESFHTWKRKLENKKPAWVQKCFSSFYLLTLDLKIGFKVEFHCCRTKSRFIWPVDDLIHRKVTFFRHFSRNDHLKNSKHNLLSARQAIIFVFCHIFSWILFAYQFLGSWTDILNICFIDYFWRCFFVHKEELLINEL